jgi:hypothetical protein
MIVKCQLETGRQFQMFLGHVLTLKRDKHGPSIRFWARIDSHMAAGNAPSNIRWARTEISFLL